MKAFLAASVATAALVTPLYAQTPGARSSGQTGTVSPEQGGQAQPVDAQTSGLAEIVVTAQKRSQNLQKVPIAVAVATAGQLTAAGVSDIANLKIVAPGVEVQSNNGYALPVIRGVGSKNTGAGIETPIAIYIDGVYYAAATSTLLSFNNISQVEVLKGPQGTLFGRNATGGLIQVTTRDPSTRPAGELNVSYGNYRTLKTDGYLSGGLTSNLSADIAVIYTRMGKGYGTNIFNGEDVYRTYHDLGLRSKWVWSSGSGTTAHLIFDYESNKNNMNAARLPAGSTAPAPYGPSFGLSPWDVDVDQQPILTTKGGGVSLRVDQSLGSVKLASITAYRRTAYHVLFDYDYTATRGRTFLVDQGDKQFSQEIQLQSDRPSTFNWTVGGFYFHATGHYPIAETSLFGPSVAAGATASLGTVSSSTQGTDSLAGFGQATLKLLEGLNLTAGLRYTTEKRSLEDATSLTKRADGSTLVTLPLSSASTRFNKLTWRFALDYQLTPDVLTYISYNRGFKSGGYNPLNLSIPPFKPEQLDAYEGGVKTTLFDRRIRFNSAIYYYDYKDVQVNISASQGAGIYNGASARIYGADFQVDARLTSRLQATVGYQYAHGRYRDFPGAVIASARPAGGTTITIGNAKGNTTLLTPKSTISTSVTYTLPLGSSDLDLNGSWYHNSGFYNDPDNFVKEPSYELVNASVRLRLRNGFSVSLWGKNLTNEAITNVDSIQTIGSVGIRRANYQPPRTYGGTIGYKF